MANLLKTAGLMTALLVAGCKGSLDKQGGAKNIKDTTVVVKFDNNGQDTLHLKATKAGYFPEDVHDLQVIDRMTLEAKNTKPQLEDLGFSLKNSSDGTKQCKEQETWLKNNEGITVIYEHSRDLNFPAATFFRESIYVTPLKGSDKFLMMIESQSQYHSRLEKDKPSSTGVEYRVPTKTSHFSTQDTLSVLQLKGKELY